MRLRYLPTYTILLLAVAISFGLPRPQNHSHAKDRAGWELALADPVLAARLTEAEAADKQLVTTLQNSYPWDEHDFLLARLLDCRNAAWSRVAAQLAREALPEPERYQALLQVSQSLRQSGAQLRESIGSLERANAHLWLRKPLIAAVQNTTALKARVDRLLHAASLKKAGQPKANRGARDEQ